MSRSPVTDPVRRLPRPAVVHAHIGHLFRELRLARRLYKLAKAADQQRAARPLAVGGQAVGRA